MGRFKPGDRVRLKSWDELVSIGTLDYFGNVVIDSGTERRCFAFNNKELCGNVFTVFAVIGKNKDMYTFNEGVTDDVEFWITDVMLDPETMSDEANTKVSFNDVLNPSSSIYVSNRGLLSDAMNKISIATPNSIITSNMTHYFNASIDTIKDGEFVKFPTTPNIGVNMAIYHMNGKTFIDEFLDEDGPVIDYDNMTSDDRCDISKLTSIIKIIKDRKEENKNMIIHDVLEIYNRRELNKINTRFNESKEEIIKSDPVASEIMQKLDELNALIKSVDPDALCLDIDDINDILGPDAVNQINKLCNDVAKERKKVRDKINEIKAMTVGCDTYEQTMKVLENYGVIVDGKIAE